jgi:hypothetical protein
MLTAISALIKSPQNNFRVFRDIKLAYGDETGTKLSDVMHDFIVPTDGTVDRTAIFSHLLLEALTLQLEPKSKSNHSIQSTQYCKKNNNNNGNDNKCQCGDSGIEIVFFIEN